MAHSTAVRVKQTRYGTYMLHYTNPDGRRRRLSLGSVQQVADHQAVQFGNWLMEGKEPEQELRNNQATEQARAITFADLYLIFLKRHGSPLIPAMQTKSLFFFKAITLCQ